MQYKITSVSFEGQPFEEFRATTPEAIMLAVSWLELRHDDVCVTDLLSLYSYRKEEILGAQRELEKRSVA
jgi:hypothetical protein